MSDKRRHYDAEMHWAVMESIGTVEMVTALTYVKHDADMLAQWMRDIGCAVHVEPIENGATR